MLGKYSGHVLQTQVQGPEGTPFHKARFELRIHVPSSYPMAPPKVKFVTPIFHPNIHFKVRCALQGKHQTPWDFSVAGFLHITLGQQFTVIFNLY